MVNTFLRAALMVIVATVAMTVESASAQSRNQSPLAHKWPAMAAGASSHACACMAKEHHPQVAQKARATKNQSPLAHKWPAMAK